MGSKRSDQHNSDPGEPGFGEIRDERVNPAARESRDRKEEAGHRGRGGMSDDERVDEASEESFPASDPPSQP